MSDPATIPGDCPRDGRDWKARCARCGSRAAGIPFVYRLSDDAQSSYVCLAETLGRACSPLPGREGVQRGRIEWVLVENKTC